MWREMGMTLGVIVVMFWNVENLFDSFDDPLKNDNEFMPGAERHWTWQRFERKRDGIAQTVVSVADESGDLPALVGLAEVENRMVVSQLVRKTMLADLGYDFVHRESPDERGIDVALLYRKDVFRVVAVDSLRVPDFPTRDILYVKLRCRVKPVMPDLVRDLDTLHVFVVHLPSKRGGARASQGRREAALAVLEHAVDSLLTEDPANPVLVMGDFNDTDTRVAGLSVPAFAGPPTVPGTLRYHGRWEQIDWFCVSPALDSAARMQIYAPPFLLEPDPAWLGVKPRRTYVGPRYNGGLSDHLPICLELWDIPPVQDK